MKTLYLIVPLAPLAGALIAGLLGWLIGRRATHWVAIIGMTVSTVGAFLVFRDVLAGNTFNGSVFMRRNDEKKVIEIAEPFGVVAAVIPSTNPTSTAIYKILISIKSRCAVVMTPHPSAARCITRTADVMYEAGRKAGLPDGAIGWMQTVTLEGTQELMKAREVSVILLADLSTSIMQLLPEGRGRLVDRVRAGILLFAESLEMVGDSYAIAGFCSKYRDNVAYYKIKDFDQPWSSDVKAQVGGLSGRLATRMGAAIRHATACFHGVSSRRRLLLLVSDGRPEDYDDGGDRRYLHEDTRMAVKEAVARGVHPFCITVDTLANEYLPQIFGRGHYLVLDHINSLPRRLPEIYLKLRR